MKLAYTRAMVRSALSGGLDDMTYTPDPVFRILVPDAVPGVPSEVLRPRDTWADKEAYDKQAVELAGLFRSHFQRYADGVSEAVRAAGPQV
jgi:phosphoenolpyruvate carboxykinase (ATP)